MEVVHLARFYFTSVEEEEKEKKRRAPISQPAWEKPDAKKIVAMRERRDRGLRRSRLACVVFPFSTKLTHKIDTSSSPLPYLVLPFFDLCCLSRALSLPHIPHSRALMKGTFRWKSAEERKKVWAEERGGKHSFFPFLSLCCSGGPPIFCKFLALLTVRKLEGGERVGRLAGG